MRMNMAIQLFKFWCNTMKYLLPKIEKLFLHILVNPLDGSTPATKLKSNFDIVTIVAPFLDTKSKNSISRLDIQLVQNYFQLLVKARRVSFFNFSRKTKFIYHKVFGKIWSIYNLSIKIFNLSTKALGALIVLFYRLKFKILIS